MGRVPDSAAQSYRAGQGILVARLRLREMADDYPGYTDSSDPRSGERWNMTNSFRVARGGLIDRSQSVSFHFNGVAYQGYAGDSLASALLANGVHLTARSFKFHRPRGIVGVGFEEPASLVQLIGDEQSANRLITEVFIRPGLTARSVNCWPSPRFDVMSINQLFARLLPAGFYYKTFMWPDWHMFEPSVRRSAGLARAPITSSHEGHYETRNAHCDLFIAGAGPAGLIATLHAGRNGVRVILADDGVVPGGSLLHQPIDIDNRNAHEWITSVVEELDTMANVTRLSQATVWAYREDNLLLVTERAPQPDSIFQRTWRIHAGSVMVATGAVERSLVFGNNDRPGVMMASAVQAYIHRYAVKAGRRAVVFTNNNSAYQVAADMAAAGIDVAAIVESRTDIDKRLRALVPGKEVLCNHMVTTTHGHQRVNAVTLRDNATNRRYKLRCDLVCISGGWNPSLQLFSQSHGTLTYNNQLATFVAAKPGQNCTCIGAASARFTLRQTFDDAVHKTGRMLDELGVHVRDELHAPVCEDEPAYAIDALWHVECDHRLAAKSFIDIQNDVTLADVRLALREGYDSIEHVKRYTTAGMGFDQGKTGNLNVIGVVADIRGVTPGEVGTTKFRSPCVPIEFGALTGTREESVYLPYRHTPITRWHQEHGAVMYEAGARWRRPGYYPRADESFQESVNRESLAVRTNVAVYDSAPLGKFEIKGPDALRFINMLYTNNFTSLTTNMGRYGIMLTEDGMILDDGVTFKLAENHYLMSTSTGNADLVHRHMEFFLQIHRPEWRVQVTPVTTQWANSTICGPRARTLMQKLGTNTDLSRGRFPFMGLRHADVAGVPARICRVSFTGELSFEINVRARDALELWKRIIEIGADLHITAIGSEANHVLRVEKGFLSLGHEADGIVDPYDLGMGWIMSKRKADHIGKRALQIRRSGNKPRRELVGLLIDDADRLASENAPITPGGRREPSEGLVTACVWSVVQNRAVALALLRDGRNRIGEKVFIRMQNNTMSAEVTVPCFHDPDGRRLRS